MPSSPASPGRTTNSASPDQMLASALTTSTWRVAAAMLLQRLRLLERLFDRADQIEGLFGESVAFAVHDHLEALDRVLERHVLAFLAGEVLGHEHRLGQEALDLARAPHRELVLGRELVHPEDRDDVAQFLVALQHRLHRARGAVVVL